MFPSFDLFWLTIYMTWIWIVIFILSTIFLIKFYSKRYNVNFWKFFNWLPLFLILPYILGSYVYHLFDSFMILPLSLNDFFLLISPYWYEFSFIGLTLWFFISLYIFLKDNDIKNEMLKWLDIMFYSICLSLVPLGFFLLLWDDFIWRPTDGFLWVSAFVPESFIYRFDSVYPLWLMMSLIAIICFIFIFFLSYALKKYWVWLFWFIILLLAFNFIFYFQYYTPYFAISIFWYIIGIKNYWTIILSALIIYYYIKWISNNNIYNKK